jgi:hypothetical protein
MILTLLLLGAPAARAQVEETPPPEVERALAAAAEAERAAEVAELAGLAAEIEARYEVLPARGGVILRPRSAGRGILSIEVADGEVAIDGERASRSAVRSRLGRDAEAILDLADLDPDRLRGLFRLGGPPPPPFELKEPPEPPEPPEAPEPRRPRRPRGVDVGQRLNILSSVTVHAGEVADQAIAIGGSVTVDGEVDDAAVAIGGPARVNGVVGTDVVAIGGSVYLGPEAVVGGDVVCVGGSVRRAEGAQIDGEIVQVSAAGALLGGERWKGGAEGWGGGWLQWGESADLVADVLWFIVLLLLVWLAVAVAPRPLARVEEKVTGDPWRSVLAGLLGLVALVPLLGLLVVSIVGCLLIPVVGLLFLVALVLGYAAVAAAVGHLLESRFEWRAGGGFRATLLGMAAIEVWWFLADALDVVGGWLAPFATFTLLFALLLFVAAMTVGFGGVILTRFGAGPRAAAAPAPAPPAVAAEREPQV